jgi:hypothetical protein
VSYAVGVRHTVPWVAPFMMRSHRMHQDGSTAVRLAAVTSTLSVVPHSALAGVV